MKRVVPSQTKSWNGFPCLEWTGSINGSGYANASYQGKKYNVSRLVASLYIDGFDINNPKQLVCHHCDNPKCIEHRHLFIGNNNANNSDARSKGRLVPFEAANRANRNRRKNASRKHN